MKKNLLILILIGLLFRLFISVGDSRGDINNHIAWGKDLAHYGFGGFYERNFPVRYGTANPNYPPLANFAFFTSQILYDGAKNGVFWLNTHVGLFPSNLIFIFDNPHLLLAFFKIWAILADCGIAYLIFLFARKIIKEENSTLPLLLSVLILFNPAFFYNSAWWGQIDSLPLVFILAGFYALLFSEKELLPLMFLVASLLSKQTAIIFLPLFLIVFFKKHHKINVIENVLAALGFFIIAFLPFYPSILVAVSAFDTYVTRILTVSGLPYISNHAFNFWALVTGLQKIPDTQQFLFGLSYRAWAYVITTILAVMILTKFIRDRMRREETIYSAFLIAFTFFMFFTRMHERHLLSALPFLLIGAAYNKKMLYPFIFLSLFHFLNLYHNWWSPPLPFIESLLSPVVIYIMIFGIIGNFIYHLRKIL